MDREEFVESNWQYLKMLSSVYARKFFAEKDDLVQEGALGVLEAFDAYAGNIDESDLTRVAKKVASRKMYNFVKKELKARRFL
ncbi:MAG: sigma-70 family RNA polymerase sigma factor [Caldisericaceae bacterium]|nr:sigma-70 family RNA polymerase sigma factor [Caldisericaceae bacterium]